MTISRIEQEAAGVKLHERIEMQLTRSSSNMKEQLQLSQNINTLLGDFQIEHPYVKEQDIDHGKMLVHSMSRHNLDRTLFESVASCKGFDLPNAFTDDHAAEKISNVGEAITNAKNYCPDYDPIADADEYYKNIEIWGLCRLKPDPAKIPDLVTCVKKHLERNVQPEYIAGSFRCLTTICQQDPSERKRIVRDFHLLGDIVRILDQYLDCSSLQWRGSQLLAILATPDTNEDTTGDVSDSHYIHALQDLCRVCVHRFNNYHHLGFWMAIRAFWGLTKDIRVAEFLASKIEWLNCKDIFPQRFNKTYPLNFLEFIDDAIKYYKTPTEKQAAPPKPRRWEGCQPFLGPAEPERQIDGSKMGFPGKYVFYDPPYHIPPSKTTLPEFMHNMDLLLISLESVRRNIVKGYHIEKQARKLPYPERPVRPTAKKPYPEMLGIGNVLLKN